MDIGGTAKKLQKMTKIAEQSYKKINEMIERMKHLEQDMETTSRQVDEMERELAEQRAIIEAMADQQGVDVTAALADADLPELDTDGEQSGDETDEETTESDGESTEESSQSADSSSDGE